MTKQTKKTVKRLGTRATMTTIETQGPVSLVRLDYESHSKPVWMVGGPDHFNQKQYWTQADEKTARYFARKLLLTLFHSNDKLTPKVKQAIDECFA